MKFVVATLPDVKFSLGRDLHLAKASALYADQTVLFSPTYSGTEPYVDFANRSVLHQLVFLAILFRDPGFVEGEVLTASQRGERVKSAVDKSKCYWKMARRWNDLAESQSLSNQGIEEQGQIADAAKKTAQILNGVYSDDTDLVRRAKEITKGKDLGLIQVQQVGELLEPWYSEKKLIDEVSTALSAPNAYGALDERFFVPFQTISQSQVRKQKVAQVAEVLFQRLPTFDEASFDEIQDIKRELAKHLTNFRRGLSNLSEDIRSQPWDEDFPHEVELEIQSKLLPEVQAIEDKVKSNSFIKNLAYRVAREPLVFPATSAFGMVLSTTLQASAIAFQVASAIAAVALFGVEAHKEWREEQNKIEENQFFFYYKAAKRLSKN